MARSEIVDHTVRVDLAYQHVIHANQHPHFTEILARPRNAQGESISPAEYVQQLEKNGGIQPFDLSMLSRGLECLKRNPDPSLRVSVNVSALSIEDPKWTNNAIQLIKASDRSTGLVIEILETQRIKDVSWATRFVRSVQDQGVKVYLDDCGTHHFEEICRVRRIRPNGIKIAHEVITELPTNAAARGIFAELMEEAQACGYTVVAEGATPLMVPALQASGVSAFQSYEFSGRPAPLHFAKPLPSPRLQ